VLKDACCPLAGYVLAMSNAFGFVLDDASLRRAAVEGVPETVNSPARQCVSGRMPQQHVDMHREWQPSGFSGSLNHASDAHPSERLTALIDKDIGSPDPVSLLLPFAALSRAHVGLQQMAPYRMLNDANRKRRQKSPSRGAMALR
jgi:hypothetical protein